jgi:hypothetical protein
MKDILFRIRLCAKHIAAAVTALQFWGDRLHEEARQQTDPKKAEAIREEAEDAFAARKSLWAQYQGDEVNHGAQASAPHATASSAAVHEGNTKLVPWLVFTAMLSGFSLATCIFVMVQFAQMQNNMARMGVHIMSSDALLLREGILQPGDQWAGPEGNLEYGRKDQPKPRKK